MQNAHLRLGRLEYLRWTANIQTRIELHVDRFMGEAEQGHLLSLYGGDAEVGAIAAAIHEQHSFTLTFPDGVNRVFSMRADASCYRGALTVSGRKHSVRHLVAVSEALHANGAAGKTYLLNYDRTLAWSTLVSFLGLPADPRWGEWLVDDLESNGKVEKLQGIGCDPVVVLATRESLMEEISKGLERGELCFPEVDGPILWPRVKVQEALTMVRYDELIA